jgi:hypothetical protein
VTECQSPAPEPSPESVRRSLRALADGSASSRPSPASANAEYDPERLRQIVEDAEHAVSCAEAAAAFLLDGRLAALDDAVTTLGNTVTTAEHHGLDGLADRGRRARAILRDLDAALVGDIER